MGKDVYETLASILMRSRGLSHADAVRVLDELQSCGRYVQELWNA
jgi:sulfite reductase alpha subunit-like flavoprotein